MEKAVDKAKGRGRPRVSEETRLTGKQVKFVELVATREGQDTASAESNLLKNTKSLMRGIFAIYNESGTMLWQTVHIVPLSKLRKPEGLPRVIFTLIRVKYVTAP